MKKSKNMSTKLPYRKNIEPLSQIVADLEKIKINRRDVSKGAGDDKKVYDGKHKVSKPNEEREMHYLSLVR